MDEKYVKRMIATLEFVVSVALAASVFALFYGFYLGIEFYGKLVFVMPGIVLGSGVMIALLTYDRQSKKMKKKKGYEKKRIRSVKKETRKKESVMTQRYF